MTTRNIAAAPPVTLEEYAALPKHPRYELAGGVRRPAQAPTLRTGLSRKE